MITVTGVVSAVPRPMRYIPDDIRHCVPGVAYNEIMLEPGDGRVTKPSLLARETFDPIAPQSEDSFLPVAYWSLRQQRQFPGQPAQRPPDTQSAMGNASGTMKVISVHPRSGRSAPIRPGMPYALGSGKGPP